MLGRGLVPLPFFRGVQEMGSTRLRLLQAVESSVVEASDEAGWKATCSQLTPRNRCPLKKQPALRQEGFLPSQQLSGNSCSAGLGESVWSTIVKLRQPVTPMTGL